MHDVNAQSHGEVSIRLPSNAFEDLGKVLFLAMDDILCEYDIPPIGVSESWEELSTERRAFFINIAKKCWTTLFLSKIEVNGRPVAPKI